MDFNHLKQKFADFTKTATEKAQELTNKTLEFAWENLSKTPLFLWNDEEFKKILEQKRVIIIAFDENNDSEKEIVKMFPIWQTKAFIDTTSLRYMNIEKSEMLLKEKNFSLPLEMRIFFEGNETQRINDLEAIKNWWKSEKRDYKGEKIFHSLAENSEKNSENDPLKI